MIFAKLAVVAPGWHVHAVSLTIWLMSDNVALTAVSRCVHDANDRPRNYCDDWWGSYHRIIYYITKLYYYRKNCLQLKPVLSRQSPCVCLLKAYQSTIKLKYPSPAYEISSCFEPNYYRLLTLLDVITDFTHVTNHPFLITTMIVW